MLWIKRILCFLAALFFVTWGALMTNNTSSLWQALGFLIFIAGITLGYIAIKQTLPRYNFWITLIAIGLAYALLITKSEIPEEKNLSGSVSRAEKTSISQETFHQKELARKKSVNNKKKKGINLQAYPKISGSATVIHAHVFYIGGRYVRLYGVDAPDNDQLCSDASGSSYNCGEVAASWVRNWIDNNVIDCYLLKVEPNGRDLATCVWGEYDIGAGLVGAGWGLANTRETSVYKPYEIKAQSESSGLWQGTFYTPADWRDIKRRSNDFKIKRRATTQNSGWFNFKSWF